MHCMGGAGRSEDCGWVEISSHEARAGVVLLQVLVTVLMCGGQLPTAVAVVLICAAAADTGLQPLEVLLRHSLNSTGAETIRVHSRAIIRIKTIMY